MVSYGIVWYRILLYHIVSYGFNSSVDASRIRKEFVSIFLHHMFAASFVKKLQDTRALCEGAHHVILSRQTDNRITQSIKGKFDQEVFRVNGVLLKKVVKKVVNFEVIDEYSCIQWFSIY